MKGFRMILAALVLALCIIIPASVINAAPIISSPKEQDITYLIGLKKNVNIKQLPFNLEGVGKIKRNYGHFPVMAVKMTPANAKSLLLNPNIKFIEPDGVVKMSEAYPWNISRIKADLAQKHDVTGQGIKIAVFDTGADTSHEDLSIAGGTSLVEGSSGYVDDNGHGTEVAGIIDAQFNQKGVIGAAPGAQIYAVKILDQYGEGNYSQIISALDWAISNNIKIVCMSFGGSQPSQALEEAMQTASDNGILLIAAAGNTQEIQYPARYPSVIAVGAVDRNNNKADFSATGTDLELVASGVGVQTTLPGNQYGTMTGTSAAAPHVAAAAALVWSQNPSYTAAQVREILNNTALPLGDASSYGNGLVDVAKALNIPPESEEPLVVPDYYLINKINRDLSENQDIGRLTAINFLDSDQETVRLHAAEVLSEYATCEDLTAMYKTRETDQSQAVRQTMALSIAKTEWRTQQNEQSKLDLLAIQLKSNYPCVRDFAAHQLAGMNTEESQALAAQYLPKEDDPARKSVLEAVSTGSDSSAAVASLAYEDEINKTVQISDYNLNQSSYYIAPGETIHTSCQVYNAHSKVTIRVKPMDASVYLTVDYRYNVPANGTISFYWTCPANQQPGNYMIWYQYNDNASNDYDTYFFFDVERSNAANESDRYEPNNSKGQATSISIGDYISAYIESYGSDVDFYRISCSGSGTLSFSMSGPSGNDYDVRLLNSSGSVVASSTNSRSSESFNAVVTAGTYYIYIYSLRGYSSDYSYDFYTDFEPASADTFEPNDSTSQAYTINVGQSYQSYISRAGDCDYYRLTPSYSGQLEVAMDPPANKDYDILLADSNNNALAYSLNGTGADEYMSCNVKGGTNYYLIVFGSDGQYGPNPYSFYTSLTSVQASLGLAVSSVTQVQSGKTLTVSATISNTSSQAATNSYAAISLPSGLSLSSDQAARQSLGTINSGSNKTVTWNLSVGSFSSNTTLAFTVTASASNADTAQISKNVTITVRAISGQAAVETIKSSPVCRPERTGEFGKSYVVCPVDTSTGAYVLNKDIFSLNGAYPFTFKVYYNSLLTSEGVMGKGWAHNLETCLETLPDHSVTIHWDKNRQNSFMYSNGQLVPQDIVNQYDTLVKQTDGSYILTLQDQSVYIFNPAGQLVQVNNGHGQLLRLGYNSSAQLNSISDPLAGQSLNMSYDSAGLLSLISDSLGRHVSFYHDTNHNLTGLTDANGNPVTYSYDSQNRLLSITNKEGIQVVTNTYDALGRVSSQDDAVTGNGVTTFAYDETSQSGKIITTVTDRNGRARVFTHDSSYQLLSIKNELGYTESYSYDGKGNLLSETDPAGRVTRYTYDNRGNILTITDPANRAQTMTYDNRNNLLRVTNTANKSVTFSYDASNNISSITDPLGNTTSFSYDSNGLLTSKTVSGAGTTTYSYQNGLLRNICDPVGITTTYTNDSAGRITGITDGGGYTTILTYDNNDNLLSSSDPLGNQTSTIYNEYGDPLSITDPRGNTTRFEYNDNGSLTKVIDAMGNPTRFEYDGEQRLTRTIDSRGNSTTLTLDAKGRVIASTNPLGQTTTYEYNPVDDLTGQTDALGRRILSITYDVLDNPVTETDAMGNVTSYQYDQFGRLAAVIDPLQRQTRYSYDAKNRVISSSDALNGQASQAFDAADRLSAIIDPSGNRTGFSYDRAGRLIAETSAWGSSKNYSYNSQNLLSEIRNGRGQSSQLSYDAAGQLISLSDSTGNITYGYDANGNVLTVSEASGTISREYDALNRVIRYTDARGNCISYTYDAVGNLTSMTYPDGKMVHYSYDAANQLTAVTDWAGRTTSYSYDNNGNLISTTRPDGSHESRTYDAMGRTISTSDVDNANQVISHYDYTYDAVGNISSEQASNTLSFDMKSVGMTYTTGNRLATYNGEPIEYDADGNMLTGPLLVEMSSFAYDARNRLTSAGDISYTYDAENNRIGINDNDKGTQTSYVINPNTVLSQVLSATDTGGTTYYVYGLGLIGQENPDGNYQSYHYDLRGSTIALTDQTGQVTDRYQYGPYGEMVKHEGDSSTPFQYGGQYGVETDSNGLCYMRARYYNPEIRRFINQDVLIGSINDSQSLNRFAYVNGQPMDSTDPFGLFSLKGVFNKVKSTVSKATQAVKQVVKQAVKKVEKVVAQVTNYVTKPSTLKTVKNVAAVIGAGAAVTALVVSAPALETVALVSTAASVIATGVQWAQEKNRYDSQVLERYGIDLAIDAVPFAAGKIAKIGSVAGKADTLLQMIEDKRDWQAAVRVGSDSFTLAMGVKGAVSLVTGDDISSANTVLSKNNKSNKDK